MELHYTPIMFMSVIPMQTRRDDSSARSIRYAFMVAVFISPHPRGHFSIKIKGAVAPSLEGGEKLGIIDEFFSGRICSGI